MLGEIDASSTLEGKIGQPKLVRMPAFAISNNDTDFDLNLEKRVKMKYYLINSDQQGEGRA